MNTTHDLRNPNLGGTVARFVHMPTQTTVIFHSLDSVTANTVKAAEEIQKIIKQPVSFDDLAYNVR